jgi:hypothetical protein
VSHENVQADSTVFHLLVGFEHLPEMVVNFFFQVGAFKPHEEFKNELIR